MINFDDVTKVNITEHQFRTLIIGSSKSAKTNALLNLIKHKAGDNFDVINKIYLYVKDPKEVIYQISY